MDEGGDYVAGVPMFHRVLLRLDGERVETRTFRGVRRADRRRAPPGAQGQLGEDEQIEEFPPIMKVIALGVWANFATAWVNTIMHEVRYRWQRREEAVPQLEGEEKQ